MLYRKSIFSPILSPIFEFVTYFDMILFQGFFIKKMFLFLPLLLFAGCFAQNTTKGLMYEIVYGDNVIITGYTGNASSLRIPDHIDGLPVTFIGKEAFAFSSLKNITIPSSITSIGERAFAYCKNLTSITIPSSVTSIGDGAFRNSGLTSIMIPESVTSIGNAIFAACASLTNVTIPSSITSIGREAFADCESLTNIIIPESVTSIGDGAFRNSGLTSITIPSSITSIGSSTFAGCINLTNVTIPSSVTSIGNAAFAGSGLISITIPSSVTSIGERAFVDCESLTSITLSRKTRFTTMFDIAIYIPSLSRSLFTPPFFPNHTNIIYSD